MTKNIKSRADGHQAAPDFLSAWVSGFYFTSSISADEGYMLEVSS
jgi:hypothetical protein